MTRTLPVLLASVLAACATSPAPRTLAAGATATLEPGAAVALPDRSTLRYVGVRDDSRCPPAVTCIRAGEATVEFDHAPSADVARRVSVVVPDAPSVRVGAWTLVVDSLGHGPAPAATIRLTAP